jgi:Flp pilus assembly protein TadD
VHGHCPADTALVMKKRKKAFPHGSVQKVRDEDLGNGLRLQVHKLRGPQDPELVTRMERGRLAAEHGDGATAASLAREVWTLGQGDKFVEVWCGQMLAKYGEREEAVGIYCASEGMEPGCWEAYWNLGRFLLMAGLHARAVEYLQEAARIEPRAIDAHLDLARCFQKMGKRAEAEAALKDARELDPGARL